MNKTMENHENAEGHQLGRDLFGRKPSHGFPLAGSGTFTRMGFRSP